MAGVREALAESRERRSQGVKGGARRESREALAGSQGRRSLSVERGARRESREAVVECQERRTQKVERGARRESRVVAQGSQEWLRKGVKSGCARGRARESAAAVIESLSAPATRLPRLPGFPSSHSPDCRLPLKGRPDLVRPTSSSHSPDCRLPRPPDVRNPAFISSTTE